MVYEGDIDSPPKRLKRLLSKFNVDTDTTKDADAWYVGAGKRGLILLTKESLSLLAHEAVHAAKGILKYLSVDDEEAECCYVEWVVRNGMAICQKCP